MLFITKMTNKNKTFQSNEEARVSCVAAKVFAKRLNEPQRDDESSRMWFGRIAREIANELRNEGYENTTAWEVYEGDGIFSIEVLIKEFKVKGDNLRLRLSMPMITDEQITQIHQLQREMIGDELLAEGKYRLTPVEGLKRLYRAAADKVIEALKDPENMKALKEQLKAEN